MQIKELHEQIESGKSLDSIIQVFPFLSTIEKKKIVDNILKGCIITDDNGITKIDYFQKKILLDLSILVNFTNFELSEEPINDYDFLVQNGYLKIIIDKIPVSEVDFIINLLEEELAQKVRLDNSIEVLLAKSLNKLIDKIPDEKSLKKLMTDIPKQINKIKPDQLSLLKDVFQQKVN